MSTLKIRLGRVKGSIWYTGTADSNTAIATALTSAGYTPIKLDMYMNTSNGNVYQYLPLDDGLQWVLQGNLRGTIGPEGLQGRGYYRANVKIDVSATTTSRANINPTNCRLLISDTIVDNVGNYFAVTANCEIGDATIKIAHRGYIGGKDGVDGLGVPSGGSTGQVLTKLSDADNDTAWKDPSGGGAGISVDVSEYYNAEENTLDIPYNTFVSLYNKFVEGATVQLVLKKTKTHQDSSTTIYYILRFVGACKYAEKSLETDEAASITYVTFSIQPYDFDYQPVVQYVQTAYSSAILLNNISIPLNPCYGLVKNTYDSTTLEPIALKARQDAEGNDIHTTYYKKPSTGIPETDLSEEVQAKLNSGGAENLLKGDVTVGDFDINDAKGSNVGYSLGIENGKKYNITATINGEEYTVTGDGVEMDGVVLLANASSPELFIEMGAVRFIAYDEASYTEGNEAPLPDDNNSLFMAMGEGLATSTIIVKSITEVEETPETYKIKQVSVTEGETMSSVVTKITNAVAEELTAQGKTSAIVAVVFNDLMIADAVSGGNANNRAFVEIFHQTCTSRVTADTMSWATPLIRAFASNNELWGSGSWAVSVQLGKVNSNTLISTSVAISGGLSFEDLSNFVADGDVTIDLIFY